MLEEETILFSKFASLYRRLESIKDNEESLGNSSISTAIYCFNRNLFIPAIVVYSIRQKSNFVSFPPFIGFCLPPFIF